MGNFSTPEKTLKNAVDLTLAHCQFAISFQCRQHELRQGRTVVTPSVMALVCVGAQTSGTLYYLFFPEYQLHGYYFEIDA